MDAAYTTPVESVSPPAESTPAPVESPEPWRDPKALKARIADAVLQSKTLRREAASLVGYARHSVNLKRRLLGQTIRGLLLWYGMARGRAYRVIEPKTRCCSPWCERARYCHRIPEIMGHALGNSGLVQDYWSSRSLLAAQAEKWLKG